MPIRRPGGALTLSLLALACIPREDSPEKGGDPVIIETGDPSGDTDPIETAIVDDTDPVVDSLPSTDTDRKSGVHTGSAGHSAPAPIDTGLLDSDQTGLVPVESADTDVPIDSDDTDTPVDTDDTDVPIDSDTPVDTDDSDDSDTPVDDTDPIPTESAHSSLPGDSSGGDHTDSPAETDLDTSPMPGDSGVPADSPDSGPPGADTFEGPPDPPETGIPGDTSAPVETGRPPGTESGSPESSPGAETAAVDTARTPDTARTFDCDGSPAGLDWWEFCCREWYEECIAAGDTGCGWICNG